MSIEQPEARKQPGVAREYANDHIVVEWEPKLCIHSARCLKALPQVFNTRARPWVNLDSASAGDIAAAVMQCPTGALRFRRVGWRTGSALGANRHRGPTQRSLLRAWPRDGNQSGQN